MLHLKPCGNEQCYKAVYVYIYIYIKNLYQITLNSMITDNNIVKLYYQQKHPKAKTTVSILLSVNFRSQTLIRSKKDNHGITVPTTSVSMDVSLSPLLSGNPKKGTQANSADPNQKPHNAAPDPGLHSLVAAFFLQNQINVKNYT